MKEKHLYILKAENGLIKIGRSGDVIKRKAAITREIGMAAVLIACIDNAGEYELQLHKKYLENRVFGEWFNLPESELPYFAELTMYQLQSEFVLRKPCKREANVVFHLPDDVREQIDEQIEAGRNSSVAAFLIEAARQHLKLIKSLKS